MKLIHLFILPLVSARVVSTQRQIPIFDHEEGKAAVLQTPAEEHTITPAIGVHFTTSYAVTAARYQNGMTRDLVKVAGGIEYIDLMSRWTEQNDGLPSSHDTGILSKFLKDVRGAIEAELGTSIKSITPAFPRLGPHMGNAIQESLAIAGLSSTRANTFIDNEIKYEEVNAAYAALGHGLCDNRFTHEGCVHGKNIQRHDSVLYFNFDNSSFSAGLTSLRTAFDVQSSYSFGMNTKLGWWNLPVFEDPRAEFWKKIQEMIVDIIQPLTRPPNKIILLGEHGADEEFKEVAKTALWEVLEFDGELMMEAVKKEDVSYIAARGAAELGWRKDEMHRQTAAIGHKSDMTGEL
ncbi:hypothetical protein GQ44DRAFT_703384 [Phaeosphaeriaceae sp. PMI808]|nr:hypothetical protein GQ44DRAFT_703384 [Phaeosphaeriaceae sp. PMI808]